MALSGQLTGRPATELDRDMGSVIWQAFVDRDLSSQLAQLAKSGKDDSELAGEIIIAWYSGICMTAAGPAVASHTRALLWKSAPFLHPWGTCGGPTGYWSEPPVNPGARA